MVPSNCTLDSGVFQDRVERGTADARRTGDVGLARAGMVGGARKSLDLFHGVGRVTLGLGAPVSLCGEPGEVGLGLHADSVKHLTIARQGRKVVYMSKRTPKQQARFEAANRRAQQIAQDRHRRLWNERVAKQEQQIIDNFIGDIATYVGAKA